MLLRASTFIALGLALFVSACSTTDYSQALKSHQLQHAQQTGMTSATVTLGDRNIHVHEYGRPTSEKPLVIMMHGFPDNLHLYDELAPRIARSYPVISFDFFGWGYSSKSKKHIYDVASLTADLDAVIRHYAPRSVVLVMHDISALPAIDWALDNEDRVERLVILNSVYARSKVLVPPEEIEFFSSKSLWRDIVVLGANLVDERWQTKHAEQLSRFFCNDAARDRYLPLFSQLGFDIRPAFFGLNGVLRDEVSRRTSHIPRMAKFTKPVHVIFGEKDPYLNAAVAEEFARWFPNSTLDLVPDGCHYVQLDSPDAVAEAMGRYLSANKLQGAKPR